MSYRFIFGWTPNELFRKMCTLCKMFTIYVFREYIGIIPENAVVIRARKEETVKTPELTRIYERNAKVFETDPRKHAEIVRIMEKSGFKLTCSVYYRAPSAKSEEIPFYDRLIFEALDIHRKALFLRGEKSYSKFYRKL